MAAPGSPNTFVTTSRRKIATAASAVVIRGMSLLLSSRELGDQLQQRRMVQPSVSLRLQRRHQLRHDRAERDHHAGLAGCSGDDPNVFVVQRDPEARLEVARQHRRALALDHGAAGQPPSTRNAASVSTPYASRNTIASASNSRCPATMSWFAALTV